MFYTSKVPEIWIFLLVFIFGIALTLWACMRLKKVDFDDVALHISNYRISVEVPLGGVEAISEGVPILPELVWISFRRSTEFGNTVVFMPKPRFFIRVSPHPIVNELWQLVSEARVQHELPGMTCCAALTARKSGRRSGASELQTRGDLTPSNDGVEHPRGAACEGLATECWPYWIVALSCSDCLVHRSLVR